MNHEAIFYHIYPLGFCGCPEKNDFYSSPVKRLEKIYGWIDHLKRLGVNALYLGPLFESTSHGYDTKDYYAVDRRLGKNRMLAEIIEKLHCEGIRVILDGVFNHVGRDFPQFRSVIEEGGNSPYCRWFHNLSFSGMSPYNDPFRYEGWNGHYNLVKLNLQNPEVKNHLFGAVEMWIREFGIDGLRLDAADCMDRDFLRELTGFCRRIKPDFWLLGEVLHGDYRMWANKESLPSVTNYELYKGLYSGHNDRNYFETGHSLNRQFGPYGLYRDLPLYNFADNHDVNRVATVLNNPAHLYTLYALLFTVPGVPSIYYGSEWGIWGRKENGSDRSLRPCLELEDISRKNPHPDLIKAISRFASIRRNSKALSYGSYREIHLSSEQLVFARETEGECIIIGINGSDKKVEMEINLPAYGGRELVDLLNENERFKISGGKAKIHIYPCWAGIMKVI